MTVKFGIFRDGQHLISGENIYVYAENGGSLPLPDDFKRRIEALEQP
jgi:acyl-CoA thioester hydrolase